MSTATIILPCEWAGSTYEGSTSRDMGRIRIGGMWRPGYVHASPYLSFAKFNFNNLVALNLKSQHIIEVKIDFTVTTTDKKNRVGLYQMLKAPVNNQFSWTKASSSVSWQNSGATGSNDRGAYYSGPELPISSSFFVSIPLTASHIIALRDGTQSIGFYTLDLGAQQYTAPYSEIQTNNINIHVTYSKPTSAIDVIMF